MTTALRVQPPVYRSLAEVRAFEHLGRLSAPGEVVLGAYATGNALPAWASLRVVVGHGPETAGLAALNPRVASFYRPETSDATRQALLAEQGVRYVWWGPAERALGEWQPSTAAYLVERFIQDGYACYEVLP
jgi:hypothetical protein